MNVNHTQFWAYTLLIGAAASFMSLPTSAIQSAAEFSLTVNLSGLRSQKGNVVVCLWQEQDGDFPICSDTASFQHTAIAASTSNVSVTFHNVPPGEYAISAFHDENGNGAIDRDLIGRPKEGLALSNMGSQGRGRPSFDQSKFTFNDAQTVSLAFKYF